MKKWMMSFAMLVLMGSHAMAADFPVGSFGCGTTKLKVSELKLGNKSLPFVETFDPYNSTIEIKGVATIVIDNPNKTVTLALVTDSPNAETMSFSFVNGKFIVPDETCK